MATALSLLIAITSFTVAFGDFSPSQSSKVLGVGRIQSVPVEAPVAVDTKFAVAQDSKATQVAELSAPIARETTEIAVPEPDPVPEPPKPDPKPANNNKPAEGKPIDEPTSDGWITTLATNYATPGDGFLNKKTASGDYTTTTSMGVAHKNLPLGTKIELYCPRTGLSCTAVVNDRGPYDGRPDTFDFQMAVTAALGNNTGWYTVKYRVL
jgi:rare lipoprotein A (peptidoglycan hydrolase)